MFDAHRHDECSTFDGFGKPEELAAIAKSYGHTALGITNHGNTNSLVAHYFACKAQNIKPILGVEGYFLPKYKQQQRGFHLCLFAKNLKGYENINAIQFAGEQQKYYNPIWDFDILEKYNEGIICSSACIASYLSQCIIKEKQEQATAFLKRMVDIFDKDFYIEIQPYKVSEKGLQEYVNEESMKFANRLGIRCILTSDSHYGSREDFDTYLKMHEIAKHSDIEITETYGERYIPTEKEIIKRFQNMHPTRHGQVFRMMTALQELEDKVNGNIFDEIQPQLPKFDKNKNSQLLIKEKVKQGLKARGKFNKQYCERAKQELAIIHHHNFEDYFLIVADYVQWAKDNNILVGPGRGSGCNSIVNYALGITNVDSILFDLDFQRFLRFDKKKMPDIDIDFETQGRYKVIDYILEKYKGKSAQICSYGLYRIDNLINDLAKVCGLDDKTEIALLKIRINQEKDNIKEFAQSSEAKQYNKQYDNIVKHFCKLYNKIRYIGTHAAGVVITSDDVSKYAAIRTDTKTGKQFTSYDLVDLEKIGVVKFDILGLTTLSCLEELQQLTGESFDESWVNDKEIIAEYAKGNTTGVFQFESKSAQEMLQNVATDSFDDIVAVNAMNRPGPIMLKMPERYAANKKDSDNIDESLAYAKYIKNTYGCILYQEQVQAICMNIGGLTPAETDIVMKMQKSRNDSAANIQAFEKNYNEFLKKFIKGAKRFNMTKEQSTEIFDKFFEYAFNKGHATGYSLLSIEEMYYKLHYPTEFWYTKMKYASGAKDDIKAMRFKVDAVQGGTVLFLPHVNYTAETSLRKVDGEMVIQEGLSSIAGVGPKAARFIEEERKRNGIFRSYDEFYDRCKGDTAKAKSKQDDKIKEGVRAITSRVIELLKVNGAIEIDKQKYIKRVLKYNSTLFAKGING